MNNYTKIIKSIKIKSKILFAVFLVFEVLFLFLLPSTVYFILASLLWGCIFLLLLAKIHSPISDALEKECDPIKFKQLFFSDVNKKASGIAALSANFNISFLTGDFETAINYANQMISDGRFNSVIAGLSNKAIAEFFKGDYDALKETVLKYHQKISEATHIKRNELQLYLNNENRLNLYVAIANNDIDNIEYLYQKLKITNNNILSHVQISFLKAVSAHLMGDNDAVKEYTDYIKNYGSKTIYAVVLSTYIK